MSCTETSQVCQRCSVVTPRCSIRHIRHTDGACTAVHVHFASYPLRRPDAQCAFIVLAAR